MNIKQNKTKQNKQTQSAKKSKTPTWNDTIQIPITDGNEMIDITVKQTAIIR